MCGIVGALGFRDELQITRVIEQMKHAIRHRGPDGHGSFISASHAIAVGHQRLSIIDLTHGADQPMTSHDGRYLIVFNGEIYNYIELRTECEQLGSRFNTNSDTEVILEAYRHWGAGCLQRFRGMWAFALYDLEKRLVFLARDPFGIKPLYWGIIDGVFYFGSEPKALRAADPRFSEVDEATVSLFSEYGYLDRGDWTFFSRIKRFPHAHYAVLSPWIADKQPSFVRYWAPPRQTIKIGFNDAAAELLRLLRQSIKIHLRSDVPVGACLSGGLDSSAIVCLGSGLLPTGNRFHTFTTRYPEYPEIDESRWAAEVAKFANAVPVFVEPRFEEFMEDFPRLVQQQDEPFGSSSIYAQFQIFKGIAKAGVKVVLDGQGADEQLAGYHGFVPIFLQDRLAKHHTWTYFREILLWNVFNKNKIKPDWNRAKESLFLKPLETGKMVPYLTQKRNAEEVQDRLEILRIEERSFEDTLTNLVVETNMPQLLRYEDRNSMAHSIESRVPFVETDLVSFVLSLPPEYKTRNGFTKAVLREALKGVVPNNVRLRRDKLGFPAPDADWMKRGFGLQNASAGGAPWRKLTLEVWRKGRNDERV